MKTSYSFFALFFLIVLGSCGSDDSPMEVVADTQSPTTPLNLIISGSSNSGWNISWEASSDNVDVTGYNVYLDGTKVKNNISGTSTNVEGLVANSRYSVYVTALDNSANESGLSNTITCNFVGIAEFKNTLSEMGIYNGEMESLTPAEGVQLYELNSTLFTDYAYKQRLVRLPNCEKMKYDNSDLLPIFPDNTLIAKTFYYNLDENDLDLGKKIIETRILIKVNGEWQAGNYVWNQDQTEAMYTNDGSVQNISYTDIAGNPQSIDYVIPDHNDCFTCHNNNNETFPIGMKLRSMNFDPSYVRQNQLTYFGLAGLLEDVTPSSISVLPDWTDANLDILDRGRAYIDINCAHCHQPGGEVTNFALDFRLETIFDDSGIYANRGEIEERIQSTLATYMMPQLGRSIVHTEAVAMLLEYLEAIE